MNSIINLTKTRILLELEEYKLHGTIPPYFLEGVFKQEFDDSREAIKHWRSELSDAGYATQFDEIEKFIVNNEVDNYTDEKEKFDLGIIAGSRIIKKKVINEFKIGILNMHPGLLPLNRGLDTHKWAVFKNWPQ